MATAQQLENLKELYEAASNSDHIWPAMAACEACLETGWLTSELGRDYNNLFGQKQSFDSDPIFWSIRMPTREYIGPQSHTDEDKQDIQNARHWVQIWATFVWFPAKMQAFTERMRLLERLQDTYPEYKAALHASTPEQYILFVSSRWSTDPDRAKKVLEIYQAHKDILQ